MDITPRPTDDQLKEISNMGFGIVNLERGMDIGRINFQTENEVRVIADMICAIEDVKAIFGVFPAPLQEALNWTRGLKPMYSAWNVQRMEEGKPATFTHLRFCKVGLY